MKLLNYGTAKDQMPSAAIMDCTMTIFGSMFRHALRRQLVMKYIHKSAITAMTTQVTNCLLPLLGPAPERLTKTSSVITGLSLGEVIRLAVNRLRPVVSPRAANGKLFMMR